MKLIRCYIFQPKQSLPPVNPLAEVQPVYDISNFNQLEFTHLIFQALISDPLTISDEIDRIFLRNLIGALDTPVSKLQAHIEFEIRELIEKFPALSGSAFAILLECLQEYNQRLRGVFCVSPILRILHSYCDKHNPKWLSSVYRNYIVPLYFADSVCEYEKAIRQITNHAISRDSFNAEYCLRELVRHWPKTNPRKEISFLQQFSLLFSRAREQMIPSMCIEVLRILVECIGSTNSAVALTASFLLYDGSFVCYFTTVKEKFMLMVIPALRKATNHWNKDLREIGQNLLNTLEDEGMINGRTSVRNSRVKTIWGRIARQACLPLIN
jgi:hypothetical protein